MSDSTYLTQAMLSTYQEEEDTGKSTVAKQITVFQMNTAYCY